MTILDVTPPLSEQSDEELNESFNYFLCLDAEDDLDYEGLYDMREVSREIEKRKNS